MSDSNHEDLHLVGDRVTAFQDLLQANLDSYNVLTEAIELLEDPGLAERFRHIALRRAKNAEDLKRCLRVNDIEPHASGTLTGFLRQVWINCRVAISTRELHPLLVELARAEDAIQSAYGDAVKQLAGSEALSFVVDQYQVIGRDSMEIKAFRNTL